MTKGEAGLLAYRKGNSPRVTYRCGRCFDRMFRELQDASGTAKIKVECTADPSNWRPACFVLIAVRTCSLQISPHRLSWRVASIPCREEWLVGFKLRWANRKL